MGIFPTALRNKKYVSSHKKYLTLLPQCIACYLTCKHAIPTLRANNQCKHSIQTFNVNIQFEHSLQTFNSNISRKHATWQYSVQISFHLCSLRVLGPTYWDFWNPKGAGNQIAFSLLLECFVRVALTILRFLQHFKAKFENVYCCMLFALSRFSICALEFINLFHLYARGLEDMAQKNRSRI